MGSPAMMWLFKDNHYLIAILGAFVGWLVVSVMVGHWGEIKAQTRAKAKGREKQKQ
jgi:hypothetical protein